jgi:translation initiation factor 4A
MINRKILKLDHIELFVLDEADVMLSRGFKENIQNIVVSLYKNTQIVLFSATIPEEVLELTDKFMNNPVKIILEPEKLSLECIQQYYIAIQSDKDKFDTLKDLFSVLQVNQSIIYVNTIERVNQLYDAMISDGFPVIYIHSNMDKHERANAMKKFRNGEYRVLISSGITARGIDIQQVSTVINFDITRDVHTYLHAIGRSGRYGRKGLAINFVTKRDIYTMKKIEEHYKINIKELPVNVNELL